MGTFGGTRRRHGVLPAEWLAVLAVVGAWLGHGVEALRLQGVSGLAASVSGPVHLYMLPVGAALALSGTLVAIWCWRLWRELGRRLTDARGLLHRSWRGGEGEPPPAATLDRRPGTLPLRVLWPALAAGQIAIYVVQENLETAISGRSVPGLGVLGGVHLPVVAVHLAVSLLLAGVVVLAGCLLERRRRLAVGCERLVRALLLLRGRRAAARRQGLLWLRPPHDRLGAQLWCRPPPLVSV
jgi:hypothetical protein